MNKDDNQENGFSRLLKTFQEAQERGDFEQAESISLQLMMLAQEESEKNPGESLRLAQEASEHEDAAHWDQAEVAHLQALALAESECNAAMIFKAHDNLSGLYLLLGKTEKSLLQAQAALAAAQKSEMVPLILMALGSIFRCRMINGDVTSAAAVADEAVRITPAERMYNLQRARALLMRARCRLEQKQFDQAQKDLDIAWEVLTPQSKARFFAGVQDSLAVWWEITARMKALTKDIAGAAEAMSHCVDFRRTVSQLPQLNGPHKHYAFATALQLYSSALMAAGETDAATKALGESQMIQMQIGISIPPSRME
jgi:tetratricopeptide (TPR) repeat protein